MGTGFISGTYKCADYNGKYGIRKIQEDAEERYGYDYYNGAANNADFRYIGEFEEVRDSSRFVPWEVRKNRKKPLSLTEFIQLRYDELNKGLGEIVRLGTAEYHIYKTEFREMRFKPSPRFRDARRGIKAPASLMKEGRHFEPVILFSGTIAECKKKAHEYLRKNLYRTDELYIIGKAKSFDVCYDKKVMKTTKKKSTDTTLVVPVYKFAYYACVPE